MAEQPAPDRPYDEPDRKQDRRIELLDNGVVAREEGVGEVEGEGGVDIEVVPLDQVAHRADEDCLDPAPHIGKAGMVACWLADRVGAGGHGGTRSIATPSQGENAHAQQKVYDPATPPRVQPSVDEGGSRPGLCN